MVYAKAGIITAILIWVLMPLSGCSRQPVWECPAGEERDRFRADVRECKAYARDMTREQAQGAKIPLGAPHGGIMGAFLTYGIFEEFFSQCMEAKGWQKKG